MLLLFFGLAVAVLYFLNFILKISKIEILVGYLFLVFAFDNHFD